MVEGFQPLILREVIIYIEAKDTTSTDMYKALGYAFLMIFSIFMVRVYRERRVTTELKLSTQWCQAVSSLIYSKILKVTPSTNKRFKKGELINITQNDVDKIKFLFENLPMVSKLPFYLLFLIIMMYIYIGWVFTIAVVIVFVFWFVSYVLARWSASIKKLHLKATDQRIHKISEIIDSIKVIKFNWLIEKYDKIVNKFRNAEVFIIVRKLLVWMINQSFNDITAPMLGVSIFMIAWLGLKISVSVPTALAIMTILNNMNSSARSLPSFVGSCIEFIISTRRIQDFLLWDEADSSIISYTNDDKVAVRFSQSNFFWGFDQQENQTTKSQKKNHKYNKLASRHKGKFISKLIIE